MRPDKLNITTYATLAAMFLHQENSSAEVIYTDIEPDILIHNPGQIFILDINDDGIADFNFLFSTTHFAYFTYFGGINFYQLNAILALPQNDNAIAAFTGSGGAYVYPYVIDEGISIGPVTGNFSDKSIQTMAYQFYAIIQSYFYYPIYIAGDWVFGETKKYVGLQLHANDSIYYGWLRLDVATNNRSFTVRDFAFETVAETAISTFIPVAINQISPTYNCDIYANANTIYINLHSTNNKNAIATIYNLEGRKILSKEINNGTNSISIENVPAGMYIVNVNCEDQIKSETILLQ
ncbi:MAG TPA: T9SS type A sorting domain-containing protein [Chitinophagales bacterium]|nr:T9SS type A sorting domain-containing protein [Chitinophagales bacterium]HRG28170.1 T9SS type A sorting domain-containing protein [Chitinophagales bacterium]HRG84728.1 T9SS type A sorting domain-containing protein [Chitinophagales bacterium]HRH52535.1 T9SS type A sorting domain-containing protein [Chitinophagales bacterium]